MIRYIVIIFLLSFIPYTGRTIAEPAKQDITVSTEPEILELDDVIPKEYKFTLDQSIDFALTNNKRICKTKN